MMPTKGLICKLFLLTLALCCLTTVYAGTIPKSKTKSVTKTSEEVTTAKSVVAAITEADEDADDDDPDDDDDDDDNSSEESDDTAEKTALQAGGETSLGVWSVVRGVWNWIKDDISTGLFGADDDTTSAVGEGRTGRAEGRTFGKIRRLQMALIPIIFKFGVLTAMVAFLVSIGLKTLFLVKVLLAMNAIALLSKFFTLKSNFGHVGHSAPPSWNWSPPQPEYSAPPSWSWSPPAHAGWSSAPAPGPVHKHEYEHAPPSAPSHPTKEIHLHIHGGQGTPQVQAYSTYSAAPVQSKGWERRSDDPYSAYETLVLSEQNDVTRDVTNVIPVSVNIPANHRMF